MDETGRKITKIAREVAKFTVQTMKEEGIGTAEFDFIHLVRHNPGITQTTVRESLQIDKGAAARRAASLESKGYLVRKPNPADGRSQLLYASKKAEALKNSKACIEAVFYEWLLAELPEDYRQFAGEIYPGRFIVLGDRGDSVLLLQQQLNRIAARDPDIPTVAEDGIFGRGTQAAVLALQRKLGIDPTGAVGPVLWAQIIARGAGY